MIGILGSHGHSLEILETHTWEQVSLLARCIAEYEAEKLNLLLRPIAAVMGIEYKDTKVGAPAKVDKAQKEAALLMFGKQNGFL